MRGIPNAPLARLCPFSRPFLRGAANGTKRAPATMAPLALYVIPRRSLTLAFGSVRDDMKTFGMTRKNGQDDAEKRAG